MVEIMHVGKLNKYNDADFVDGYSINGLNSFIQNTLNFRYENFTVKVI